MKVLIVSFYFLTSSVLISQELMIYRTEPLGLSYYNPASYGSINMFSSNVAVNLTSYQSFSSYLAFVFNTELCIKIKNSNFGFGTGLNLNQQNDFHFKLNFISIPLNLNYNFKKINLSVGLSPGIRQRDFTKVNYHFGHTNNNQSYLKQNSFTYDVGIFAHGYKMFGGFTLFNNTINLNDSLLYKENLRYAFDIGYQFNMTEKYLVILNGRYGSFNYGGNMFDTKLVFCFVNFGFSLGVGYTSLRTPYFLAGYEGQRISGYYSFGSDLSYLSNSPIISNQIRLSYRVRKKTSCTTIRFF